MNYIFFLMSIRKKLRGNFKDKKKLKNFIYLFFSLTIVITISISFNFYIYIDATRVLMFLIACSMLIILLYFLSEEIKRSNSSG